MFKRSKLIFAVFSVLAAILLIAGCTEQATPTSAPAPAMTTTSPAASQPIELKFSATTPPESINSKNFEAWGRKIEERTNGQVKIKFYFGGSLLKAPEVFRGTRSGIADIGVYQVGIEGGLLELNTFPELHFLGLGDHFTATKLAGELYKGFPALSKEYTDAGLKLYKVNIFPGYQLHTSNKAVKTPGDLKGLKIISTGGPLALAINKGGGAPLDLPVGEYYTSLEKSLANGIVTNPGLLVTFKLGELLRYHTEFGASGFTTRLHVFMFNINSWNKLSPDAQKVINDLEAEMTDMTAQGFEGELKAYRANAEKAKDTFINLTPEEVKVWADIYTAEHQEWIQKLESKGKPGKELYTKINELVKKYSK